MLAAVGVDEKALNAMNGIMLVPSDTAVDEFAGSMGGLDAVLSNKHLADQVTAYHFLPGISVKQDFKAPNFPLITKTAEPNYVVRFFKDRNTNKAWVQDMQGNKVPLSQQPVVEGNLTLVPIDKVLMSGSYFRSFADAMRLHAQLSKADELLKAAGGLAGAPDNVALLVPVNKAFESSKVSASSLHQADVRKVLEYHTITPARPATQLRSGTRPTLLSGHTVRVDSETSGEIKAPWSGKSVPKPVITVIDESGNKADVVLYNIWAGKGVIHGISKVLQPNKGGAAVSTEKAPAQAAAAKQPTSSSNSGRRLLQLLQDSLAGWAAGQHSTMPVHRKFLNRQLLQNNPGSFLPDWSQQSNPASALLSENTVAAAYAADAKFQKAYYALPDSPGWVSQNHWESWQTN